MILVVVIPLRTMFNDILMVHGLINGSHFVIVIEENCWDCYPIVIGVKHVLFDSEAFHSIKRTPVWYHSRPQSET